MKESEFGHYFIPRIFILPIIHVIIKSICLKHCISIQETLIIVISTLFCTFYTFFMMGYCLEMHMLKYHFLAYPNRIRVFFFREFIFSLLFFPFTLEKNSNVIYRGNKVKIEIFKWKIFVKIHPFFNLVFLFFSLFFISTSYWIEQDFSETSSNQVKFLLLVNTASKLTTKYIRVFIKNSIIMPLIVSTILYIILKKIMDAKICLWILKSKPKFNFHLTLFTFLIFIGSISDFLYHIGAIQYFEFLDDKFIEKNYADPKNITITFPENKRNLIVAIIESMESSFTDPKYGGVFKRNYIPLLTEHAMNPKNVHFSHNKMVGGPIQTEGAQWSIGGYMALFSGLPLKPSLRMKGFEPFLPKSKMIIDVLKENGYDQYMIFPHSRKFLASGSFFETHGAKVMDTDDIKRNLGKYADIRGGWDFPDYVLYNYTKQFIANVSSTGKPFNVMFVTLDTHLPFGSLCKLCRFESNLQEERVQYCADRQASDFINWVQNSPFAHNTTLVVVGDHVTMIPTFAYMVKKSKRHMYNLFVNSAKTPSQSTKNRKYHSFDIAPSLLSAIGANISGNRFALGTDLFSNQKTLGEIYGPETVNSLLTHHSNFYDNEINGVSNDLELTIDNLDMFSNISKFE